MDASAVKESVSRLDIDLCGIANIERFQGLAAEYHPRSILIGCKSVIVIGCRILEGILDSKKMLPYNVVWKTLADRMDSLAEQLCMEMEREGTVAVPVGAGRIHRDGRHGMLQQDRFPMQYAAHYAGLGIIGKNHIFITPEFGNMVMFNAILTEGKLKPDPMFSENYCRKCKKCLDCCPVNAFSERQLDEELCMQYSCKGDDRNPVTCNRCRVVCPMRYGANNLHMRRW
jgi:epoxyqueuosine reductase QueG